jgi:hypothetical protein
LQEIIERPEETDHVLRLGLHRLAITEFPVLRALAPALASYDGAAELDRGLDLLLPGLTATLTTPTDHPEPPDPDDHRAELRLRRVGDPKDRSLTTDGIVRAR